MGRTNWKIFSFVLLILASGPGCRDRNAPEISVRNPTPTSPTDQAKPKDPTADPTKNPTDPAADPTNNPANAKTSVLTLGALETINGQVWAVALVTLQDAETGVIKFAETFSHSPLGQRLEVPYGSYLITVEYFLDAAKTKSLARSCEAERTRIHKISQETYNVIHTVCTVGGGVTPVSGDSDVVIRPVIIRN